MGLKSTWWIADESDTGCPFCSQMGCDECDPDWEDFYAGINDVVLPPKDTK